MDAEARLNTLYATWRVLTEAEAQAIQAAEWPAVARAQREKEALQTSIERVLEEARGQWRRLKLDARVASEPFRQIVAELAALEQVNSRALAVKRRAAEQHRQELHRAGRNLRQVQQAYAAASLPAWQAYS